MQLNHVHPSWQPLIQRALLNVDPAYLETLQNTSDWLPGPQNIFNAFSIPLSKTQHILFGESPYPRKHSANGYAFWDASVHALWSETGLATAVNRATSLRNLIKMLLIASDRLSPTDTSQSTIARLDKTGLIQTNEELFQNFLAKGFLLLNTALVFRENQVNRDARAWRPFIISLLNQLDSQGKHPKLWLLGRIAATIMTLDQANKFEKIQAEHPYNLRFVQNKFIINLFKPLRLLERP